MRNYFSVCRIVAAVIMTLSVTGCGVSGAVRSDTEPKGSVSGEENSVRTPDNALQSDSEIDMSVMDYPEGKISALMESDEYKNADQQRKYELAYELLSSLEQEGCIRNLYYDEDTALFSFQYENGVLSGIQLKGFDEDIDGFALN